MRGIRYQVERLRGWLYSLLRTKETLSLEVFLAVQSLLVGAYILWPGASVFARTLVVPEVVIGGLMATHGVGALWALYHLDMGMCRRSALSSVAVWSFLLALLYMTPPFDLIVIPLILGLAVGAAWAYVRLSLLYRAMGP